MESVPDAVAAKQNRESPHASQRIGKRIQKASNRFGQPETPAGMQESIRKTIYRRIRPPSGMSSVFSLAFSSGASK